jgi:hypothetical protein
MTTRAIYKILVWDSTGKKLYSRIPGESWEEWPSQPTLTGPAAYGMTGVPDGSILTQNPSGWDMFHWDPNLSTWINRGHPGALANFNYAVWAGTQDIILGGGIPTGRVAIYDGASQTWTDLGSRGPYTIRPAQNCTLNDVWCIGHLSGNGEIFHWDGATWTTHRADMVSQVGDPGRITNCDRIGNNLYIAAEYYGRTCYLRLAKRDCNTGIWTLIGNCVGYGAGNGMRAFNDNCIWIGGSVGYPYSNGTQIFKWNGSSLTANKYLGPLGTSDDGNVGVVSEDIAYCYYGSTANKIYETLDGGVNWTDTSWPGLYQSAFSTYWEVVEEIPVVIVETAPAPEIGFQFNVNSIQVLAEPHREDIFGAFDNQGLVLSTERLLGETNWEYKRRLRNVFVQKANSTYKGMINGITNGLGLSLFHAISINPKIDSSGRFLAADPYLKFDESYLYLYSDYSQDLLDYQIDRLSQGGNYENLQSLITLINSTPFFVASLEPGVTGTTRTAGLLNQSNRESIKELVPCSNKFKLSYKYIVSGTLFFSDRKVFATEMTSEVLVRQLGHYYVDYTNGIVTVFTTPGKDIEARYDYTVYPFQALASPIVLHHITQDSYKIQLFQQILQDDGTYAHQLPTALGVDIINELLSVGGLYFGK